MSQEHDEEVAWETFLWKCFLTRPVEGAPFFC
jgi:hypothetical protein